VIRDRDQGFVNYLTVETKILNFLTKAKTACHIYSGASVNFQEKPSREIIQLFRRTFFTYFVNPDPNPDPQHQLLCLCYSYESGSWVKYIQKRMAAKEQIDSLLMHEVALILKVADAGRLGRSDHCILKVTLDLEPGPTEKTRIKFNWSKANIEEMKSDLSTVNWRETLAEKTVEAAWNIFKDKLNDTVERNVPKIRSRTRLKNPWMTRD
jgi:hypothetical protein